MRRLRLTLAHLDRMRLHVQASLPHEACGLLAGTGDSVEAVIPVTNQAHSPVRFRMEPREQLQAFEHIDSRGWTLLGIYHSHPAGPDAPSETDIAEAAYRVIYLVWSSHDGAWETRAFWIEDGRVSDVKLDVLGGA